MDVKKTFRKLIDNVPEETIKEVDEKMIEWTKTAITSLTSVLTEYLVKTKVVAKLITKLKK